MAASAVPVAGTVEVHQRGDVTLGERRDIVYVDNGRDTAGLVEKKTTVAAVPIEGGTAVVSNVEYTPLAAATYSAPEESQQRELQRTDDYQSTQRIPSMVTSTVNRQRAAPPSPQPHRPAAPRTHAHPPPYHQVARGNTGNPRRIRAKWNKYCRRFYITWVVLASFLGIAGALFIGLGELTRKCDVPSKHMYVFELWTSSFVTGGVMILFTVCVWLASFSHYCCFKNQRELCTGLVTGCGIVALFFFIIAYGFNISSVGHVVDTPPSGTNSTNHDSDCLSPYWLAYIPSFALGAVIVASIFNLCCCLCCRVCLCSRRKGYERLP